MLFNVGQTGDVSMLYLCRHALFAKCASRLRLLFIVFWV